MKCPRCGWSGPPTTRQDDCYECVTGRKTENHHPWNVASFPELKSTIPTPASVNQLLGHRWGERCNELKYPGADPLRRLAAAIATIGEGVGCLADYARQNDWPEWVANIAALFARAATSGAHWLLCLSAALNRYFGEDWAAALDMPPWCPPGDDE